MTDAESLTERERRVLEAVVEAYIDTAEPVASQSVARRSSLGLSSASIRTTMSDLEVKRFLFHPHTSAGRIPTDRAYRLYVNTMMQKQPVDSQTQELLEMELAGVARASEDILRRAAQVLGILTQELGVAVGPALDELVLDRLDLVGVSSERLLLVLHLRSGSVRTIYVRLPGLVAPDLVEEVQRLLNERCAGHTLRALRGTVADRLRDAATSGGVADLLDIILSENEALFGFQDGVEPVVLGSAAPLADQPEFASAERMRTLLTLTDQRDLLQEALLYRRRTGVTISIGDEHADPGLVGFTLVTSTYRRGDATGVIGVLGPTRMPYNKIISLVEHTGRLVEGLLH